MPTITTDDKNVDFENVLGTHLPTVYVSKITLESSTHVGPKGVDNPHIETNENSEIQENKPVGFQGYEDALNQRNLVVTLNLIVKEKLQPNGMFTLMGMDNLYDFQSVLQFLEVSVLQSVNPDDTTDIANSPSNYFFAPKYFDKNVPENASIRGQKLGFVGLFGEGPDGSGPNSVIKVDEGLDGLVTSDYDLNDPETKNIKFTKEVDADGNVTYNLPFTLQFTTPAHDPAHLTYFVAANLNLDEIASTFDFEYYTMSNNLLSAMDKVSLGPVKQEVVIQDGSINKYGHVFLKSDKSIWLGPIHEHTATNPAPDGYVGYMGGYAHSPATKQPKLTLQKVVSGKILDYRDIPEIDKLVYDYSSGGKLLNPSTLLSKFKTPQSSLTSNLNAAITSETTTSQTNLGVEPEKKNYFSDILLSRDHNGNCRFFFTMDFAKIIKDNSIFPKLIENIKALALLSGNFSEYHTLMNSCKILDFKIKRKRVINRTFVGDLGEKLGHELHDKNVGDLLICRTSELDPGNFKAATFASNPNFVDTDISPTSQKLMGGIRELAINLDNVSSPGLRHFTGIDIDVGKSPMSPKEPAGFYQYGLEMEVTDPTIAYLNIKLSALKFEVLSMKKYYLMATDFPGLYDVNTNRFTKTFIDKIKQTYGTYANTGVAKGPQKQAIQEYMRILGMLAGLVSTKDEKMMKLEESLNKLSSPDTGNPSGIEAVYKLMQSAVIELQRTIDSSSSSNRHKAPPKSSHIYPADSSGKPKDAGRTFKVDYYFEDNTFNANLNINSGYDFLSRDTGTEIQKSLQAPLMAATTGLRLLSSAHYTERTKEETLSYFKELDSKIDISLPDEVYSTTSDSLAKSRYSYLSPSIVFVDGAPEKLLLQKKHLGQGESPAFYRETLLDIIRANSRKNNVGSFEEVSQLGLDEIGLSTSEQKMRYELMRYFADKGCTFEDGTAPAGETATVELLESSFTRVQIALEEYKDHFAGMLLSNENPNKMAMALMGVNDLEILKPGSATQKYFEVGGDKFLQAVIQNAAAFGGSSSPSNLKKVIANLPNQIKFLLLHSVASPAVTNLGGEDLQIQLKAKKVDLFRNPNFTGFNWLNFQNLAKVQVLTGYKVLDGEINLKAPTFTTLTEQKYKTAGTKEIMVCRTRKYWKPYFDASLTSKASMLLDMPIYNEHFLLEQSLDAPTTVAGTTITTAAPLTDEGASTFTMEDLGISSLYVNMTPKPLLPIGAPIANMNLKGLTTGTVVSFVKATSGFSLQHFDTLTDKVATTSGTALRKDDEEKQEHDWALDSPEIFNFRNNNEDED